MVHHKKTWPNYFEDLAQGRKRFDIRLADFIVSEGDIIIFEEWDPKINTFTGRRLEKKISYIVKTKDLSYWSSDEVEKYGYQILQLE